MDTGYYDPEAILAESQVRPSLRHRPPLQSSDAQELERTHTARFAEPLPRALCRSQTNQVKFNVRLPGLGPTLSSELESEGNPDVRTAPARRFPHALARAPARRSRAIAHAREQVPNNHEMRLPFWLAKVLKGKSAVDMKLPRHFEYKGRFRQQLALDPSRMNLKEKDPRCECCLPTA